MNFRKFLTEKKLNIIQTFALVISSLAVPVVVASFQSSSAKSSIAQEYVKVAVNILEDKNTEKDEKLRAWAVNVINKYSPVPFSGELASQLMQGSVSITGSFPSTQLKLSPPSDLMTPCDPLPVLRKNTMGDLVIYSSDLMTAYGYCGLKLQALQKWVAANN